MTLNLAEMSVAKTRPSVPYRALIFIVITAVTSKMRHFHSSKLLSNETNSEQTWEVECVRHDQNSATVVCRKLSKSVAVQL